jgi:cytochrome c oxidase subunit II
MNEMSFRPPAASQFAEDVDKLFGVLCALTFLFTALVMVLIVVLVVRYQRGNKVDRSRPITHNTFLEMVWTVPPLVLGLGVFIWAAKLFAGVYAPPANAKEVFVIGKQWMWHIQHSNGLRENNELHVPVGEPVKLTMISQDVIHAFYVPEFRLQRHVEPGRYTTMWFTPTRPGKYHLYCNMYCGTQHSEMGGWVYVMERPEYEKWVANGMARSYQPGGISARSGALSLAQQGASLFNKYQCVECHGPDAVANKKGPSLVGIYGKMRQLADGRRVLADDAYLRNVTLYPNEYPLAGWSLGMPTYKGTISESELLAINAYVKSLGSAAPAPAGGNPGPRTPAVDTDNQQWRYMYGGEQYQ